MTPIQQLYLGVGASKKTYLDDVFNTYLYTGNGTARSINNGLDLSGEGGLVWNKCRNQAQGSALFDTAQGVNKYTSSDSTAAVSAGYSDTLTAFNSNGFSLGADNGSDKVNRNAYTYSNWSFRKALGFFDVVTWSGTGSARTVAHSLGSLPGMILVKCTSETQNWAVYHRGVTTTSSTTPAHYRLKLDDTHAQLDYAAYWNDTEPTSTQFTVGDDVSTNKNGATYIAYLFAGGESTAATANSIELDGTNDYLSAGSSSDFNMGTGDFTVEGWFKSDDVTSQGLFQISPTSGGLQGSNYADTVLAWVSSDDTVKFGAAGAEQQPPLKAYNGQWFHAALVRNSGTTSLYVNGIVAKSVSDTTNYNGTYIAVGGYYNTSYTWGGHVSNFRVVKGTAVYTSSFNPPTEPLTNVTNTKLLCCQSSTDATAAAVTPGTITLNGTGQAHSTDSPFDDPSGFKFGEGGDQNIIKTGSYIGNGSTTGPEVNLGFEPQYLLVKRTDSTDSWVIVDSMRGIVTGGNEARLKADNSGAEAGTHDQTELTPTGFKVVSADGEWNANNGTYIYMAIRRPDGYVGKPAELGTDVFAMATGQSSTLPDYVSGFPVDFGMFRTPTETDNWYSGARLTAQHYILLDTTDAESSYSYNTFDYNTGWGSHGGRNSTYQSWMWKRHAGFDSLAFTGNGLAGRQMPHNLGRVPEMIWCKRRDGVTGWAVYHKGLNGGTNPGQYGLNLAVSDAEMDVNDFWNDTEPTATAITLGNGGWTNYDTWKFTCLLFASVDGISKVGYYDGNSTDKAITTGFQPRFLLIKNVTFAYDWVLFDSVRGLTASGNDPRLYINTDAAQSSGANYITALNSTSFTASRPNGSNIVNAENQKYIYYAHA